MDFHTFPWEVIVNTFKSLANFQIHQLFTDITNEKEVHYLFHTQKSIFQLNIICFCGKQNVFYLFINFLII